MLIAFILLLATLIFSIQFKRVQTWAAKKATVFLSEELQTKIEIKSLYLKPFKSLVLEGFLVEDLEGDTLLQTPRLTVDIGYFSPIREKKISLDYIELENGRFFLKEYKDSTTNLSFIIDYFSPTKKDTTISKKPFELTLNDVNIKNLDFRYINYKAPAFVGKGVNFD
ncbi:MAG: translocation/assembly module TamB, partial [Pedobacter sp.]